jgi:hypothetical protein
MAGPVHLTGASRPEDRPARRLGTWSPSPLPCLLADVPIWKYLCRGH